MGSRFHNIDALRGVAAIAVLVQHLLGHVWRANPAETQWLKAIGLDYFDWGRFGVVLFFLISGYVIPLSFSGQTPLRKFAISRFFRLYPAYWLSMGALLVVMVIARQTIDARQVLANLTMAYPAFGTHALSGVYWTLVIELLFYVITAGLFFFDALELPSAVAGLALLSVASAVVPITANEAGFHLPATLLGYHLSFLMLGCLIRQTLQRTPHALPMAAIVGGVLAVTLPFMCAQQQPVYSLAKPIGAMLAVAAALGVFLISWHARFSRQGAIALSLGAWSYSIYLLHEPIAAAVEMTMPAGPVFFLLTCALSIGAAAVVYRFVEQPFIALGRRLASRRTVRPANSDVDLHRGWAT